jgi:hypothetical protein
VVHSFSRTLQQVGARSTASPKRANARHSTPHWAIRNTSSEEALLNVFQARRGGGQQRVDVHMVEGALRVLQGSPSHLHCRPCPTSVLPIVI